MGSCHVSYVAGRDTQHTWNTHTVNSSRAPLHSHTVIQPPYTAHLAHHDRRIHNQARAVATATAAATATATIQHDNTIRHDTTYDMIRHDTPQYDTMTPHDMTRTHDDRYDTIRHDTIRHNMTRHNTRDPYQLSRHPCTPISCVRCTSSHIHRHRQHSHRHSHRLRTDACMHAPSPMSNETYA